MGVECKVWHDEAGDDYVAQETRLDLYYWNPEFRLRLRKHHVTGPATEHANHF